MRVTLVLQGSVAEIWLTFTTLLKAVPDSEFFYLVCRMWG